MTWSAACVHYKNPVATGTNLTRCVTYPDRHGILSSGNRTVALFDIDATTCTCPNCTNAVLHMGLEVSDSDNNDVPITRPNKVDGSIYPVILWNYDLVTYNTTVYHVITA
jgi:hypothetical protein